VDLSVAKQNIEPSEAVVKILKRGQIDSKDYYVGRTMIFVKNDSIKSLIQYQRHALSMWGPLISLFEAMLLRKRTHNKIQQVTPGLKRFQANIRKYVEVSKVFFFFNFSFSRLIYS
jgi:myosin heavy subunit